MYLVVFLFDKYDNDVASNSEALLQAEPLIIYNDSLYKVIDFVFNNKSRIEVDNTIYSLVETKYSDVQTYSPDAKSNTKEVLNMDEVFHKVLLFNYKRETES